MGYLRFGFHRQPINWFEILRLDEYRLSRYPCVAGGLHNGYYGLRNESYRHRPSVKASR